MSSVRNGFALTSAFLFFFHIWNVMKSPFLYKLVYIIVGIPLAWAIMILLHKESKSQMATHPPNRVPRQAALRTVLYMI